MFKTYNKEDLLSVAKDMDNKAGKWALITMLWTAAVGFGITKLMYCTSQYAAFKGKQATLRLIANDIEETENEDN